MQTPKTCLNPLCWLAEASLHFLCLPLRDWQDDLGCFNSHVFLKKFVLHPLCLMMAPCRLLILGTESDSLYMTLGTLGPVLAFCGDPVSRVWSFSFPVVVGSPPNLMKVTAVLGHLGDASAGGSWS